MTSTGTVEIPSPGNRPRAPRQARPTGTSAIVNASSATVELVGLNVTGGYVTDDNGGGISITGGQVTLLQVNIYSNTAKYTNSNGVSANALQQRSWVQQAPKCPHDRVLSPLWQNGGGVSISGSSTTVDLQACHIFSNTAVVSPHLLNLP